MKVTPKLLVMLGTALLIAGSIITVAPWDTQIPPCEHEDSNGCYWDAETMGNGKGRSFTVDQNGNVTYWDGGK